MTLRYAYFPGCVAQGACRELYLSTQALTQALGIELVELKKASCCGSGTFKEDSQLLEDTVNARNIALAESLNLPLLTHCSTCQGVIGHVDDRLKSAQKTNPAYLEQVNGLLKQEGCSPYKGSTDVKHLLWALVGDYGLEALQQKVTRKTLWLKVRLFLRLLPTAIAANSALRRPPTAPNRWKTCSGRSVQPLSTTGGAPNAVVGRSLAMQPSNLSKWRVGTFKKRSPLEPICIVTPCPLCHLNLDSRQPEVAQVVGEKLGLPVFAFTPVSCAGVRH